METDADSSSTIETTASSIVNLFLNEVNKQDVGGLLSVQNSLYVQSFFSNKQYLFQTFSIRLEELDKTNEKLDSINKISANRYLDATREFTNHAQMLTTMKTDLDLIFKRIKYDKE